MKVFNIRQGLATNSSSSHSMIRADGIKTELRGTQSWGSSNSYGWDNFTLADRDSKLEYLATALKEVIPDDQIRELCELKSTFNLEAAYIDHQSEGDLFHLSPDPEYLQALKAYIVQDDVVILGGNDNSDGHPLNSYDNRAERRVYFGRTGEDQVNDQW